MRLRKRPPVSFVCKKVGHCIYVLLHNHGEVCRVKCRCSACPPRPLPARLVGSFRIGVSTALESR